nr:MAG: hypothetical protein [Metapenaeopsis lamellata majanivirus]
MPTKKTNGGEPHNFGEINEVNNSSGNVFHQTIPKSFKDGIPIRKLNYWIICILIIFLCIAIIILSEFDSDNYKCIASLNLCILGILFSIPNIYPIVDKVKY